MVRLIIQGNLVADPVLGTAKNGQTVCNFVVACNRYQGKDKEEKTYYVRVTVWGHRAETWSAALKKGTGVVMWGPTDLHTWNDSRDGSARGAFELTGEGFSYTGGGRQTEPEDDDCPCGEGADDDGA